MLLKNTIGSFDLTKVPIIGFGWSDVWSMLNSRAAITFGHQRQSRSSGQIPVETKSNFNVEKTFDFVKTNQRWSITLFQRWNLTLFQCWNLTLFQLWNLTCFNVEIWRCLNVDIWRFNVEIWRCFNVEIWRWFKVEIWRYFIVMFRSWNDVLKWVVFLTLKSITMFQNWKKSTFKQRCVTAWVCPIWAGVSLQYWTYALVLSWFIFYDIDWKDILYIYMTPDLREQTFHR